jgi:hypothetical protein
MNLEQIVEDVIRDVSRAPRYREARLALVRAVVGGGREDAILADIMRQDPAFLQAISAIENTGWNDEMLHSLAQVAMAALPEPMAIFSALAESPPEIGEDFGQYWRRRQVSAQTRAVQSQPQKGLLVIALLTAVAVVAIGVASKVQIGYIVLAVVTVVPALTALVFGAVSWIRKTAAPISLQVPRTESRWIFRCHRCGYIPSHQVHQQCPKCHAGEVVAFEIKVPVPPKQT